MHSCLVPLALNSTFLPTKAWVRPQKDPCLPFVLYRHFCRGVHATALHHRSNLSPCEIRPVCCVYVTSFSCLGILYPRHCLADVSHPFSYFDRGYGGWGSPRDLYHCRRFDLDYSSDCWREDNLDPPFGLDHRHIYASFLHVVSYDLHFSGFCHVYPSPVAHGSSSSPSVVRYSSFCGVY